MQSWVVCHGYNQVTELIWSAINYSAYFIGLRFNFILEVLGSWRNANPKAGSALRAPLSLWAVVATGQMVTATSLSVQLFELWNPPPVEQLFLFSTFVSTGESAASVDDCEALEPSGDRNFPLCFLQILDSKHNSFCSTFSAGVGYSSAVALFRTDMLCLICWFYSFFSFSKTCRALLASGLICPWSSFSYSGSIFKCSA